LPDRTLDLRLDQADENLRRWLLAAGYGCFAIITAHNPGSRQLAAAENAERQTRLERQLIADGYEVFPAAHIADGGRWPIEASCFVPDLAVTEAVALAADFGQNAIVCGGQDGVPRLQFR
jgi:hypothetical protein